jgi:hypothetical protein
MNTEEQEKLITSIGNLILLNGAVNKKIQNDFITKKRAAYEAIIQKDKFLQTPINTVDFDEFAKELMENRIKNKDIPQIVRQNQYKKRHEAAIKELMGK